jgi:arylsulfatase A-like enzyme
MLYYLTLWFFSIFTFLMLNFSKHIEMLMDGLSFGDRALNFFAVMPLAWLASLVFAGLSTAAERLGFPRLVHFVIFFFFLTVNIWSIKYEAESILISLRPSSLAMVGHVCLAISLLVSGLASWKRKKRIALIDDHKSTILKGFLGLSAVGVLGFMMPGPRQPVLPPSDAPNVIIVTFDSLSARNMSCYGYERETTPNIDSLASESWVFDNFHSAYNYTPASITSLQGNLADLKNPKMWSREPGLFEVLRMNGYPHRGYYSFWSSYTFFHQHLSAGSVTRSGKRSIIYRTWRHLFTEKQLLWMSQLLSEELITFVPYFDSYYDEIFWTKDQRPGDLSFEDALQFLSDHPTGALVWIHLWEPHYPYWPAVEFQDRFGPYEITPPGFVNRPYRPGTQPLVDGLRNRYDAMVLTADSMFGEFLSKLKAKGLYDTSYLIVSADHGESFDYGFFGHSGGVVFESISHIPLIIHAPGNTEQKRISTIAGGLDLTPTILDLVGVKKLATMPGESLLPYIQDPTKMSDLVKFTVSYFAVYGNPGEVALYWKNYKAVYLNQDRRNVRLFDLSTDPNTTTDIAKSNPEIVETIMKGGGVW